MLLKIDGISFGSKALVRKFQRSLSVILQKAFGGEKHQLRMKKGRPPLFVGKDRMKFKFSAKLY